MKIVGILTEYNPMHRGHLAQIQKTKAKLGEDCAFVAVMSGNFVQRGDFAIMNKTARARAAVLGGVDLVVELPVPFSLSSAEGFASAAVGLMADMKTVTDISFGSECGDVGALRAAACALRSADFPERLKEKLKTGASFAAARGAALSEMSGVDAEVIAGPNNILGIEYLKALEENGCAINPLTVRREGGGYNDETLGECPSASAVRAALLSGGFEMVKNHLCHGEILAAEIAAGRAPVDGSCSGRAILSRLRRMSAEDWSKIDGTGEGLCNRFYSCAQSAVSVEQLIDGVKSKRYARSRICRTVMLAYLGIEREDMSGRVPYVRPLAFNERGQKILAQIKKSSDLPILTKPADIVRLGSAAQRMFAVEAAAGDMYALAYPDMSQSAGGSEWRITPAVL